MNIQFVLAAVLLVGAFVAAEVQATGTCTMERCVTGCECPPVNDGDISKASNFTVTCKEGDCKTHVEVGYVEEWTLYKTYDNWGQECRCRSDGSVSCK
ncbi:uncharacterized protein LOC135503359 isoform X2 [Lineus longissimus]